MAVHDLVITDLGGVSSVGDGLVLVVDDDLLRGRQCPVNVAHQLMDAKGRQNLRLPQQKILAGQANGGDAEGGSWDKSRARRGGDRGDGGESAEARGRGSSNGAHGVVKLKDLIP